MAPKDSPIAHEFKYPHDLVERFAHRLLHALQGGHITMRVVWRVHIKPKSVSSGRVRPGYGDHVITDFNDRRDPVVFLSLIHI